MNDSNKGAYKELLVAAVLTKAGWDVYRAVSPAALCDLLAVKGLRTLRIEVKSPVKKGLPKSGTLPKAWQRHQADTYAAVADDNTVAWYGVNPL